MAFPGLLFSISAACLFHNLCSLISLAVYHRPPSLDCKLHEDRDLVCFGHKCISSTYVCSVAESCLTLRDPMNCSPQGSPVRGILQAKILEWVAISSSRDLPNPGIKPTSLMPPALAGRFFSTRATWETLSPAPGTVNKYLLNERTFSYPSKTDGIFLCKELWRLLSCSRALLIFSLVLLCMDLPLLSDQPGLLVSLSLATSSDLGPGLQEGASCACLMVNKGKPSQHGLRETTEGTQRDSRWILVGICFSLPEDVCSALIISG